MKTKKIWQHLSKNIIVSSKFFKKSLCFYDFMSLFSGDEIDWFGYCRPRSWRARVCWPLLCLCRRFCIFERCLDSNLESCRSMRILGSVPLTNESGCGSGSPKNIGIQIRNSCTFTSFFKDKKSSRSFNSRHQGISYYFCLMMEGSGPRAGSVLLTNGSGCGSGRPTITRILIPNAEIKLNCSSRIQLRIPNTQAIVPIYIYIKDDCFVFIGLLERRSSGQPITRPCVTSRVAGRGTSTMRSGSRTMWQNRYRTQYRD